MKRVALAVWGNTLTKVLKPLPLRIVSEVAHRDSSGGGGVIREGDVQWMTAGSGVIHEEFHSEDPLAAVVECLKWCNYG